MKYVWEETDIKPGQFFQKSDCGLSGVWIISYYPNMDDSVPRKGNVFGITSLVDGLFITVGNMLDMVEHLNSCGHYRPIE